MITKNNLSSKIILASESISRKTILKNVGLEFDTIPSPVNETELKNVYERKKNGEVLPKEMALFLAEQKALGVSAFHLDACVIGCDQILSLDDKIFHKPESMLEAFEHLSKLSGKTHTLTSGIVLVKNKIKIWECVDVAHLKMRPLSKERILKYLDSVKERILKTVGGYEIESEGIQLFEEINGNYFTIRGLPLLPLLAQLRSQEMIE